MAHASVGRLECSDRGHSRPPMWLQVELLQTQLQARRAAHLSLLFHVLASGIDASDASSLVGTPGGKKTGAVLLACNEASGGAME